MDRNDAAVRNHNRSGPNGWMGREKSVCPVCMSKYGGKFHSSVTSGDRTRFSCEMCGEFEVTGSVRALTAADSLEQPLHPPLDFVAEAALDGGSRVDRQSRHRERPADRRGQHYSVAFAGIAIEVGSGLGGELLRQHEIGAAVECVSPDSDCRCPPCPHPPTAATASAREASRFASEK